MELWNRKDLAIPPTLCCIAPIKETDIKVLECILKSSVEFFQNQQHLHTEAALTSRIIYRMKMKFRSAKDFKCLQKLNQALLAYLRMNIDEDLIKFQRMIPEVFKPKAIYMPSKNMLDYLLVRLQGLGKVFERIINTCRLSAVYQQKGLRLGHFWNVVVIVYGIISRVFVIAKNILKHICDLYTTLLPYTMKLRNTGVQWLPNDYILPQSLSDWLEIEKLDLDTSIIEIPDEGFTSYFNLIDESDDDLEINDEYVLIDDEQTEENYMRNPDSIINLVTPYKRENIQDESVICLDASNLIDIGEDIAQVKKPTKKRKKKQKCKDPSNNRNLNTKIQPAYECPVNVATPRTTKKRVTRSSTKSIAPPKKKAKLEQTQTNNSPTENNAICLQTTPMEDREITLAKRQYLKFDNSASEKPVHIAQNIRRRKVPRYFEVENDTQTEDTNIGNEKKSLDKQKYENFITQTLNMPEQEQIAKNSKKRRDVKGKRNSEGKTGTRNNLEPAALLKKMRKLKNKRKRFKRKMKQKAEEQQNTN